MEKLLGEILAQRVMLAQLLEFVAAKQDDRELFLANYREACLRSLSVSNLGGGDGAEIVRAASEVIADTCDTAGRAA